MMQRCCRPWQASRFLYRANELCKRTGEKLDWGKDYRNHRAETHCKNAGMSRFTTPRHLFTDNRSSGFCTAFRTVSSAIHWMILNARRVSRNATPFRDWIKFRTIDHCAECFSCYPYYRTHLFDECARIFVAILSPGGYIKKCLST